MAQRVQTQRVICSYKGSATKGEKAMRNLHLQGHVHGARTVSRPAQHTCTLHTVRPCCQHVVSTDATCVTGTAHHVVSTNATGGRSATHTPCILNILNILNSCCTHTPRDARSIYSTNTKHREETLRSNTYTPCLMKSLEAGMGGHSCHAPRR